MENVLGAREGAGANLKGISRDCVGHGHADLGIALDEFRAKPRIDTQNVVAIPFNYLLANINARVGRVRDSLSSGLVRVLDHFQERPAVGREKGHA